MQTELLKQGSSFMFKEYWESMPNSDNSSLFSVLDIQVCTEIEIETPCTAEPSNVIEDLTYRWSYILHKQQMPFGEEFFK